MRRRDRSPRASRARAAAVRFLRWWTGELAQLLPRRWRLAWRRRSEAPTVALREGALVRLAEDGSAPAHAPAPGRPVRLCLEEPHYLEKRVRLPLAAEEDLRTVLGFEMNRLTPFRAEQVHFAWRVARRDAAGAAIELDLMVAPRREVDARLARLEALGARACALVCASELARPAPHADLLAGAAAPPRSRARLALWLDLSAAALLAALAGLALAIPLWHKHEAARALLPHLEAARKEALAARDLETELAKLAEEANFPLRRKHAEPPLAALVEALARALPDTAWIETLEIRPGGRAEVSVAGETSEAARLVEALESTRLLRNVTFRAPLVKSQAGGKERFILGAEIVPAAPAATVAALPQPPGTVR